MTPLSRWVARNIPKPLQVPVLALLYAAMIAAIFITSRTESARIIYIDVRGE